MNGDLSGTDTDTDTDTTQLGVESTQLGDLSTQLGDDSPWCHHCNSSHKMDIMTITMVYLTTSTLSGFPFLGGWPGLPVHCDWEAVSGVQLDTLRKAWERAYGSHGHALDNILADSRAPKGSQPGQQ